MADFRILITGGTGTLGRELVRQLCQEYSITVMSRDEQKHHELKKEYPMIHSIIGDVAHGAFGDYDFDWVIHAAAMKHVGLGEEHPEECVRINVGGTYEVIEMCKSIRVKKAVFISTDKAAYPICVYGATKLIGERMFIEANKMGKCAFSVVRSGNMVESAGSVIPYWKKLAAEGKPLPVCREAVRYWISVEDFAKFIIARLKDMKGGEVFIPPCYRRPVLDMALEISQNVKYISKKKYEKMDEILFTREEMEDWNKTVCIT